MAQSGGLLNTAPSPIPGGGTNPTGINTGITPPNSKSALTAGAPPLGALPTTYTPQVANTGAPSSLFPANGYSNDPSGGMAGLSSGMSLNDLLKYNPNLYGLLGRELTDAFGRGTGMLLFNMLTNGLFNPQIANALINAMQPMRTRGINDLESSFGGAGARFSSAAAIGEGDFESQFAANEQATLANLFMKDQAMQTSLLENILPTLHAENVNRTSSGFLNYLLGGLETAAGIALDFVPGAQVIGTGLIGSGVNTMVSGANRGGGGGGINGVNLPLSLPMNVDPIIYDHWGSNSGITGLPESTPSASADAWKDIILSGSAGSTIGGVDNSTLGDQGIVPFVS